MDTAVMADGSGPDDAWTADDAARFLGLARKTVYAWAASGKLPSMKVGGARRFSPARLTEWRDSQSGGGK